jgi:hypothetical protein
LDHFQKVTDPKALEVFDMVALENHHFASPRTRWKTHYRAHRVYRHRHDRRAQFWQLAIVLLAAFWLAVGYGIYALT